MASKTDSALKPMAGPLEDAAESGTGKRLHRKGAETREKILRTAERMFAARGLDGVSLRELTEAAGVDLAMINYHFKTKDKLYEAVHALRLDLISAERQRRLRALPAVCRLGDVISCFLDPYLEKLKSPDLGWRYSADLSVQVTFLERYRSFRSEHLDETAEVFVCKLAELFPAADRRSLYWAYGLMIGGLTTILSRSDRLFILSNGGCDVRDLDTAFDQLRTFTVGGINALITEGLGGSR